MFSHQVTKKPNKMSLKLATNPCIQYNQNPVKGRQIPHVFGIGTKGLSPTACQLKSRKQRGDHGILNEKSIRMGLKGLFELAAIILDKETSKDDNSKAEEQNNEPSQAESVSLFRLSSQSQLLLDTVKRFLVKRPKLKKEMEILLIHGVENAEGEVEFDVYINKASGNMVDADYGEFVGSEVDVCNGSFEVDVTNLIAAIGVEDSDTVVVTLVPRTGKSITIQGVRIVARGEVGDVQIHNQFSYRKDETRKLVMINVKNEFQISKNIVRDASLVIWLITYIVLLFSFKDIFTDLARMLH